MAGINFTFLFDIQVIKSTLSHLLGSSSGVPELSQKNPGHAKALKRLDAYRPRSLPSSRPNLDTP